MSTNERLSLLINSQVPNFIREEHPKFVAFLEAYYRFLEEQELTNNDLITKSKSLRFLSDVDQSIDSFETQFFNTFLSLLPRDVSVPKEVLVKNILPAYLSKGSENSFKLLFRMLFGDEITVKYPKNNILRASSGKWKKESLLLMSDVLQTEQYGNGTTKEFYLNQVLEPTDFQVYLNGVAKTYGTDYFYRRETKKLIFNVAPSNGVKVVVVYNVFDTSTLVNKRILGTTSGSYSIVESIDRSSGPYNSYLNVFINKKTKVGTFIDGEEFTVDVSNDTYTNVLVRMVSLSTIKTIQIIDGGSRYNVGDPITITGLSTVKGTAIVGSVASGFISEISVVDGGSGFTSGLKITANNIDPSIFSGVVNVVDASGVYTPNTVSFSTDIIAPYSGVLLSAPNYGFPSTNITAGENVSTVIADALSSNTLTIGSILSASVVNSYAVVENTTLGSESPIATKDVANNTTITLTDLGIIGKIGITNGGLNYSVGDTLNFSALPMSFSGSGVQAKVSHVAANGAITNVLVTNGGFGYRTSEFPTITINSGTGSGASLYVHSLLGDGELLNGLTPSGLKAGQILTIKLLSGGRGYKTAPIIDLTKIGDGQATALSEIYNTYTELPGIWTTSEGQISTEDIRLEGREYYVNYSYILSTKTEFEKYKNILKELIHPAGMVVFNEYNVYNEIEQNEISVNTPTLIKTVAGTVNVNSSIYVTGTNTKFNVAVTAGILAVGNTISINSESRVVLSIQSNTNLTVSSAFTISSNNETLRVTG